MAEGALLKAMLSAAMAARSDPGRFGRGKSYIRDGSVTSLEVGVGVLSGNVAGSRRVPYEVEVRVPTLGQRAFEMLEDGTKGLKDLVPGAREIRCTCTCPDDVTTCKHAVAVVLAFAEQLTVRPELLVDWRGGDTDTTIPDEPEERSRFDALAAPSRRYLHRSTPTSPPSSVRLPMRPRSPISRSYKICRSSTCTSVRSTSARSSKTRCSRSARPCGADLGPRGYERYISCRLSPSASAVGEIGLSQ